MEGKGVGLGQHPAVVGMDGKFIGGVALQAGDKDLPNSAADGGEGALLLLPAVEVSHQVDLLGVGGPDPEPVTRRAVLAGGVGAQEILKVGLAALEETVQNGVVGALCVCRHKMTSQWIW